MFFVRDFWWSLPRLWSVIIVFFFNTSVCGVLSSLANCRGFPTVHWNNIESTKDRLPRISGTVPLMTRATPVLHHRSHHTIILAQRHHHTKTSSPSLCHHVITSLRQPQATSSDLLVISTSDITHSQSCTTPRQTLSIIKKLREVCMGDSA